MIIEGARLLTFMNTDELNQATIQKHINGKRKVNGASNKDKFYYGEIYASIY